ncbi:uncharacterized protein LOC132722044 [Ruditapes philippinarum]|uniref:uncharacterized protein LOC132722044 n=1 Tax=Ruditapes philippinarum TaxID=129788 RepID=UPI00295AB9B3|nr:uncharacterized protein LOC132722044 [Ruditapes philippinarum]
MSNLEIKVKNLETKSTEAENSLAFINSAFENQKSELQESREQVNALQNRCIDLAEYNHILQKQAENVQDKPLDLETRSMRSNLIFYGLNKPEPPEPNDTREPEDCDKLVKDLIRETLDLEVNDMVFDRAHRLGGIRSKRPRPIVVKFKDYADREKVRQKSYEHDIKINLKAQQQGIGIQTPQPYREARKAFTDFIASENIDEGTARISGTKLYINNKISKKYVNGKIVIHNTY